MGRFQGKVVLISGGALGKAAAEVRRLVAEGGQVVSSFETDRGDQVSARFLIMATGCLATARTPDFPGLKSFRVRWYHTGRWPHEPVDLSDHRVGLIGTGLSGIQAASAIAEQAEHLSRTYLGPRTVGFPKLFIITGPGSLSVLTNMAATIERHVDWTADRLSHMRTRGHDVVESTENAEHDWVTHVNEIAERTLFTQANSWYMAANIPGRPRVSMPYVGGFANCRRVCDEVAAEGYPGFVLQ